MTQTPPPKRETGAIQKAVQVRRTQEMLKQQEERRKNERLTPEERKALEELKNKPPEKPVTNPAARATAVHSVVSTPPAPDRQSLTDAVLSRTGWTRQQLQIALGAMLGVVLLCGVITLLALFASPGGGTAAPTRTLAALPVASVAELPEQFRQLGLTFSNFQNLTVPSTNWQATQGIRFDVTQGKEHGTFLLLVYSATDKVSQDAFRAGINDTWAKWTRRQYSNLLLVASPDTTEKLLQQVDSMLYNRYVAPARPWQTLVPPTPKK